MKIIAMNKVSLYVDAFAAKMKACRIVVNTPSAHGGIGDLYNFKLTPSLTLGCGSWGGNSVSENAGVKHLLNIKSVAERRENMLWFRAPEKVYFKKGCLPVALDELKKYKKAFIVTDTFLYQNGYTRPVKEKLDQLGIIHNTFHAVEPDVIIAIGGGSAMDAANALMIDEVLRFNAVEIPTKMGTFSQYDHPHTLERYAEVADYLGLGGKTNEE